MKRTWFCGDCSCGLSVSITLNIVLVSAYSLYVILLLSFLVLVYSSKYFSPREFSPSALRLNCPGYVACIISNTSVLGLPLASGLFSLLFPLKYTIMMSDGFSSLSSAMGVAILIGMFGSP